jgi:hypothetical protein
MNLLGWLSKRNEKQRPEPEIEFFALPVTEPELFVLLKCVIAAGKSEQTDAADKLLLNSISGRLLRWAERQGAFWDDGQNVIYSTKEKIDP